MLCSTSPAPLPPPRFCLECALRSAKLKPARGTLFNILGMVSPKRKCPTCHQRGVYGRSVMRTCPEVDALVKKARGGCGDANGPSRPFFTPPACAGAFSFSSHAQFFFPSRPSPLPPPQICPEQWKARAAEAEEKLHDRSIDPSTQWLVYDARLNETDGAVFEAPLSRVPSKTMLCFGAGGAGF